MFQFVIDKRLEECKCACIAGVGIEPLDKPFHHGPQIAGGVDPVRIGLQLKGGAVKVETAVEPRQPLPVVLVPENRPLAQDIRRIRVARVAGHGPRQQLSLVVELHRTAGDCAGIDH